MVGGFKMIKVKGFNEKLEHWFIGFGLTETNIALLKQGIPLFIEGKELETDHDFFIFVGGTDKEMYNMLREYIDSDVKIFKGREQ
jgi:hypothetical protein